MTAGLRRRLGGYAYIAVATLTWGTLPVIIDAADAPAPTLVGLRMGFGALALGVVVAVFHRHELWPRTHRMLLAGLGVLLAVHWVLFFRAIQLIGATAVVLTFSFPLLVALLAPRVLREERERHVLPLAAVGLVGTAIIVASEETGAGALGTTLALATAVMGAFLVMGSRRLADVVAGPVIAFWQEVVGFAILIPWIAVTATASDIPWRWGVLIGVVHTAAASILFFRALTRISAQETGVLMYVEPASAVLFVWAFNGVVPTMADAAGGFLVLAAGIALVVGSTRRLRLGEPEVGGAPVFTASSGPDAR